MKEQIIKTKKIFALTMIIMIIVSGLLPTLTTTVKAAPSTISGTCTIKLTTTIITPNAEFDVIIDGKVYKGYCLDPMYAAPLNGTYKYTGTLESDGGYNIVVHSMYLASSSQDIHPISRGHINVPYPISTQRVGGFKIYLKGNAQLTKATKNNQHLVNLCPEQYSLEGAKYGIYSDSACRNLMNTLIIGKNGKSQVVSDLDAGTYYIKEIFAPKGYKLDTKIHSVDVTAGQTVTVSVADEPLFDPLQLRIIKKAEDGTDRNLSLEGAEYTVKYYKEYLTKENIEKGANPFRRWIFRTDNLGQISLRDQWKIGGDELFKLENGMPVGLAGTYTIEETKAPQGFARTKGIISLQQVKFGQTIEPVTVLKDVIDEEKTQKINLHIHKKDAETGKYEAQGYGTLAGAIFEIFHFDPLTAEDTKVGEITTDKTGKGSLNGLKVGLYTIKEKTAPKGYLKNNILFEIKARITEINTAFFDYTTEVLEQPTTVELTKVKGNGTGFEALAGAKLQLLDENAKELETWISSTEAKVIKGLEIGKTYTVKELEAPQGYYKRANDFTFTVEDTADVQKHNILNEEMPTIQSNARFKDGSKRGNYGKIEIKDKVILENLLTEDEAKMLGDQHTPEYTYTMQAISVDSGNVVDEQVKTFTSNAKTKELEFIVNMDNLDIGEEIYFSGKLTRNGADYEIKHNKDNTDINQLVQAWRIKTKLIVASTINDKEVYEDMKTKAKDIIKYSKYDKYVGQKVIVKSVLMDKATKKPFMDKDGKKVEATTEVKIKESNGKFELVFPEFNSTGFNGNLVCFEEIYDKDGKKIDEHKDFNDKNQTIKIITKPRIIKTDDNNLIFNYILLMTIAVIIFFREKLKKIINSVYK